MYKLLIIVILIALGVYLYRSTPIIITKEVQVPVQVPVEVPVYTNAIQWDYGSPRWYWHNRRWGGAGWGSGGGRWRGGSGRGGGRR